MVSVRNHRHKCRVEIARLLPVIVGTPINAQKAGGCGKLYVLDDGAAVKAAFFRDGRI